MTTITLSLPDNLVPQAQSAGLLRSAATGCLSTKPKQQLLSIIDTFIAAQAPTAQRSGSRS